ncbi:MAG: stage II sporulation protein M [Candidatus Eremiobacteraeota bacterium]|nr:stage II sporulation protein M [Candidatus Eremiobacteraeota bacterium]MBC5827084.1 stage II sporulation protein M [Candidatus Eremiobacteraeota bacterium]
MRQALFVEQRSAKWRRLEELLLAAQRRGLRALRPEEIGDLGMLYRWVTSDLAYAGARPYDPNLQAYLNRLTARAHAVVYGVGSQRGQTRIMNFVTRDFPVELRASRWYVLACATIFALAAALAYWLVADKPLNAYIVIPAAMLEPIRKSLHDSNFGFDRDLAPMMSAAIITNNIKVAVMAFAGGMTLGALTVWSIVQNGLLLGGYGALFASAGYGYDFWATVAPHGIIELTAIQIAGAAGLLLAAAVYNPGQLRRIDALKRNARRAGTLILGVTLMLVVAGIIEGFFSPLRSPAGVRVLVAAVGALGMAWYFGFAGSGRLAGTPHLLNPYRSPRDLTST